VIALPMALAISALTLIGQPTLSAECLCWVTHHDGGMWDFGRLEDGTWFDRDGLPIEPVAIQPLPAQPEF